MKEVLRNELLSLRTKEEIHEVYELMKRLQTHLKGLATVQFNVGDKVSFVHNGIKLVGVVKKINPTTIKVFVEKTNQMWRCSALSLKKE